MEVECRVCLEEVRALLNYDETLIIGSDIKLCVLTFKGSTCIDYEIFVSTPHEERK